MSRLKCYLPENNPCADRGSTHSGRTTPTDMRNLTLLIPFSIALSALFSIAIDARAEITGTASVEWLTCTSKIVAVGRISKITSVKGPGQVIYKDCVLAVSESIKGDAAKEVEFCYRHFPEEEKSWKKPDQDLLVFLSVWKDHYTDEQARGGGFRDPSYEIRMHGKVVPTGSGLSSFCIMTLSRLPDLFDKDMKRISDRESVLGLCRKWASSPIVNSIQEEAPWGSEVQRKYDGGSSVLFEVPAEKKHRVRFLKMVKSEDPSERATAAGELWKFPGNETEEALRSLLRDQSETVWKYANDTISEIEYGVRSAAFRSLQQLGKAVEPLALGRKPTVDEQRKCRQDAWLKSFKQGLPDGWEVASIRDGETRSIDSRQWTVVLVQLVSGGGKCDLILIPKELDKDTAADHQYLGINGRDSQGARRFYSHGRIPDSLKTRLVQSFGLVID